LELLPVEDITMTTDDGLKGLIDFLTRYNKWRRRNDDDDSEFIEMPLPRDIGIAIDEAIAHLTKLAANVHDSGDGERLDFLESLAVADIDEQAITRLAIFNLWRGTTYDNLRAAIDAAILAGKGEV